MLVRLILFLLSVVLAYPACTAGWSSLKSAAFVVEFLTGGSLPILTTLTVRPVRSSLPLNLQPPYPAADLYRPVRLGRVPGLVLVHGLTPYGKNDPALQKAAGLLSRVGFMVVVPTVAGLTNLRLRPDDVGPVIASIERLETVQGVEKQQIALLGVSVGGGVALLAAADHRVAEKVSTVVSLGGYSSTRELLRYFLTGAYQYGARSGQTAPQPEAARSFLLQNLDLLKSQSDRRKLSELLATSSKGDVRELGAEGQAVYRLLENRDPRQVASLIDTLPEDLRQMIDRLSPMSALPNLRARLVLLHSVSDPAIPFTESLRLADAARERLDVTLLLLHLMAHVEPEERAFPLKDALSESLQLWSVVYQLLKR